ncbi:MAG: ATP synthase F1 subunit gamma [bacterium]|nr:ATP synthase F1 subunit gamma [bacterium]
MESLQTIKSRLRAVNNIGKITRAMEVVAATKMRRAQEVAINSRPYSFQALELLSRLIAQHKNPDMPILKDREIKNTLLVIVSSDRGLVGSFNNQLFRVVSEYIKNNSLTAKNFSVVTVGKKAMNFADKNGYKIEQKFLNFGNMVRTTEMAAVSNMIIDGYLASKWDRVVAISMNFKSTIVQNAVTRQILPVDFEMIKKIVKDIVPERGRYAGLAIPVDLSRAASRDYIFEPSKTEILSSLIPHLIKMQFYHLMLEANASEHSARRVAMKTASDNADEVAGKLSLDYNKVRQSNITRELIEITSTQGALQG